MTNNPYSLKVLYHMHPSLDLLDLAGPLEILSHTPAHSTGVPVFINTTTSFTPSITTAQNLVLQRDISLSDAYASLADFDVLIIPGGGSEGVLEGLNEPIGLIKAFVELPKRTDGRVRTLLSVCTGSLFLGAAGVLDGLSVTTHAAYYDKLHEVTKGKATVVAERFIVNATDEEQGLRIVTSGGVSCGIDSCLWLIEDVAGEEAKEKAAWTIQYASRPGEGVVL